MPIMWKSPPSPQNPLLSLPLNLTGEHSESLNLKSVIEETLSKIAFIQNSQMFIWIEAEKYCGAEFALFKTLSQKEFLESSKICYCSCFDIKELDFYNFFEDVDADFGTTEFFLSGLTTKIMVIDHAELIENPQKVLEFSRQLHINEIKNVLGIFIAKRNKRSDFWRNVCETAELGVPGMAIRKSHTIYTVSALTKQQVIDAIYESNISAKKKERITSKSDSFDHYLHRHYFLDRLISYLAQPETDVPDTFKDYSLMLALHRNQLENTFQISSSLSGFFYEFNNKISIDNDGSGESPYAWFAWAYGATRFCEDRGNIDRVIDETLRKFNDFEMAVHVFEEIFSLCDQFHKNKLTLLEVLSSNGINGADIAAKITIRYFASIPDVIRNNIFENLCNQYLTDANICPNYNICEKGQERRTCDGEIKSRFSLGLSIGILVPQMPSKTIERALSVFFKEVQDDYVVPQINTDGISRCVITNFEFKKFVDDNGYSTIREFGFPSAEQLKDSYYELYKNLIGIIQEASSSNNDKIRRVIAMTLKGSDWRHYNRIAHILAEMRENKDTHKIEVLCDVLEEYYAEDLISPVKWNNPYNSSDLFCNPLQPVVGISLFEARAYVAWLSKKTGRDIHLVDYNPDYISIVGTKETNDSDLSRRRLDFDNHKNDDFLSLINTRENSNCYYGPSNSDRQEPATVGLIQRPIFELFDFCGNTFEMQNTEFSPIDQNSIVHQPEDVQPWQKVYNCSGGGWQHTRIRIPTEYMGQFTACTRNHDIGFRVVIGTRNVFSVNNEKKSKDTSVPLLTYDYPVQERFKLSNEMIINLNEITLSSLKNSGEPLNGENAVSFSKNNEIHSLRIFSTLSADKQNIERIMLLAIGYDIYAYHLIPLAFYDNSVVDEEYVDVIMRKPQFALNSLSRKRLSNKACSYVIDCVQTVSKGHTEIYIPYSADISCGKLIVDKRAKRVGNRNMSNHIGRLGGAYTININNATYKSQLFEKIKWNLSGEFFLPDWIDLFEFINLNAAKSDESTALDCGTTMSVLSTIDTVDLHSLIRIKQGDDNENILVNRREYETMKREFKRLKGLEIFS
jgi:formylglycine-generating enzyme required for sulfatase activity